MNKINMIKSVFFTIITTVLLSLGVYAQDLDNAYNILQSAVEKKINLGERMTPQDIKYVLLSLPVKKNVPYLAEVIQDKNQNEELRVRAFYTLSLMGGKDNKETIKSFLSTATLPAGDLIFYMAMADSKEYKDLIIDTFNELNKKDLYHPQLIPAGEAMALLKNRDADNELKKYFNKIKEQDLSHISSKDMLVILKSLYACRHRLKNNNTCINIIEELSQKPFYEVRFFAPVVLYCYGQEGKALSYIKELNNKISSGEFDKYGFYKEVYNKYHKELGLRLMMEFLRDDPQVPLKTRQEYMDLLAVHRYPGLQEYLTETIEGEKPAFEHACFILAVYYNDWRVKMCVRKQFPKDIYWTDEKKEEREDMALAYLVLSDKRDELFYKQLTEDVSLIKKAYGCEGERFINARGKKPEFQFLFDRMDFKNPEQNGVSFQCGRALFRFGLKHFFTKLVETKDIPDSIKKEGLLSLARTGDKEDIELLKFYVKKIHPPLYDSYLYALSRIARQDTVPLLARNKGERDEPLRDSLLLMKEIINNSPREFACKSALYIEPYTYHWQSVTLLKDCVQSSDPEIKINGMISFRNFDDNATIWKIQKALQRCMTDPDEKVRTASAVIYAILQLRLNRTFHKKWSEEE